MVVIKRITLLGFVLLLGCSDPNQDLKILSAEVVEHKGMPQLKVCFNRNFDKGFISDVKVTTKDGYTFGRSDMVMSFASTLTDDVCLYESPYFFLRNTRDDSLRQQFLESMKPENIKKINIKLGSIPVNLMYSDEYALTSYTRTY